MSKNLLIGAISGNYDVADISTWIKTSMSTDSGTSPCDRVLLLYNPRGTLIQSYCEESGVKVVIPNTDFFGQDRSTFTCDTGVCDLTTSYDLIHNIRFLHIWKYLTDHPEYEKVLVTDVRDVKFTDIFKVFEVVPSDLLLATSEMIRYMDEDWNASHLLHNLGTIGIHTLYDKEVYNVGVFGGKADLVKQIAADIYLMSVGKSKVADQTSFNYLIQTKYKYITLFARLQYKFAVHLHVINAGLVPFDLSTMDEYLVIHQYDRLPK